MSQLEDVCMVLTAIDAQVDAMARELHGRARACRAAAQRAAAAHTVDGASGAGATHAAVALQAAARSAEHAAALLAQAAHEGRRFVARTVVTGADGAGSAAVSSGGGSTGLTADDLAALGDYTGVGYRAVNDALRGGSTMTPGIEERAGAISAALAKLPDCSGTVHRGTTLTPEQIAAYVPGTVYVDDAFTSATSDRTVAFEGNVLFVIESQHGKAVAAFSSVPHEQEVLFDKGARFFVADVEFSPRLNKYVISLMEV